MNLESPGPPRLGKRLLIASFTAPQNQDGVAMAVGLMAREMKVRGWDVFITATEPEKPTVIDPIHFHAIPTIAARTPERLTQDALEKLFKWIDGVEPSVIVIHSWIDWPTPALMTYAKKRAVPIFVMGHGFGAHLMQWVPKPPFFGLARWARSWVLVIKMILWIRQMKGLVVLGKEPHYVRAFDHWLARKIKSKHIHVIPNAIKPLEPNPIDFRKIHGINEKLLILCLAGYSPRKDQILVLNGFLKARIADSVMVFIGPAWNEYAAKLQSAAEPPCASVLLLHGLPRNEVEASIKSCDIAILGSESEMQPIFLLEAMSEGKPWICPKVGAVDELEGGIVCGRTAGELAAALVQLSTPSLRMSLGASGKQQWQAEFRTETVYNKWDEILTNSISC